jgi:UDP-N-acetylglucosamine 2-epimerase (non-hydrolysing)
MSVFGTRPEAIKMAPVVRAFEQDDAIESTVVVTGQHREMLDQVLEAFEIRADLDLNLFQHGQSIADITVRILSGLTRLLAARRPNMVVVQGDTTTTFAAALASYYSRVHVAHLEAGLRTGDKWSPYPEEINRRLTSQLASLHLAATRRARDNLLAEGFDETAVVVTGNTVIDALLWTKQRWADVSDPVIRVIEKHRGPVLLVTAHRRESWGDALREVGRAVAEISCERPDLLVVIPVHRNPIVRKALLAPLENRSNVMVVEPLPYIPFVQAMARATVILTDSGGVQEEAPSLGKPVLVMRDTTERSEGVEAGTAQLVGTNRTAIRQNVLHLLSDERAYEAMAKVANPYGDGQASARVVGAIRRFFGRPMASTGSSDWQ